MATYTWGPAHHPVTLHQHWVTPVISLSQFSLQSPFISTGSHQSSVSLQSPFISTGSHQSSVCLSSLSSHPSSALGHTSHQSVSVLSPVTLHQQWVTPVISLSQFSLQSPFISIGSHQSSVCLSSLSRYLS